MEPMVLFGAFIVLLCMHMSFTDSLKDLGNYLRKRKMNSRKKATKSSIIIGRMKLLFSRKHLATF